MTVPVSPSGIAPRTINVSISSEQVEVSGPGVWILFSVALPEQVNEEVAAAVKAGAAAMYESLATSFPSPPAGMYASINYDGIWDTVPDYYPFS